MNIYFAVLCVTISLYAAILNYRLRGMAQLLVTDPLTRVYNRRWLDKRSKKLHGFCAAFYFDLDDFKKINDTQGHDVGDQILKRFCETINFRKRNTDTLIRMGGDEFVLIAPAVDDLGVGRLQHQFARALRAAGVAATTGIATTQDRVFLPALVSRAETDMRAQKAARKVGR